VSQSLVKEAKRLNKDQHLQYVHLKSVGSRDSKNVKEMLDFVNPRTIDIRQNKYNPEPIISQSIVTNPKLFVPNYPSKINYTAQNYDFITHSKQKELS